MKASFTNLSLQKKIGLLVLTGLTVGLGLFSWLGIQSLKENTQRALDERLIIARIIANLLDKTLTDTIQHLSTAAGAYRELPSKEEFSDMADSLHRDLADSQISVPDLILTGRDGRAADVSPYDPGIMAADISVYPEVARTLRTGVPTVSNLVTDLAGTQVVIVTVPFFNPNQEVIGGLSALMDINQSKFGTFDRGIRIGDTGYTEIVDGNGLVITRTEPGLPLKTSEKSDHPGRFAELIREGKAAVGTCHRCHETQQNQVQRRRDVLSFAPLASATWGVAIRQSEEEALAPTRQLEKQLILLGFIVVLGALLLAWAIMRGVVRPIQMLKTAVMKVAGGDFKAAIPTQRKDEIGQLSNAFAGMTHELASSRDQLMSRNRELSALNSIAAKVSESLNLQDVLENAFNKVLEVTHTTAGGIFLRDTQDNELKLIYSTGPAGIFRCQNSGLPAADCACHQVWRHKQTLMVNHPSQCPRLSDEAIQNDVGSFISVPLKSKNRILGVMNVACTGDYDFTEDDMRLLDSIGYHIGLAIENAILYEEAKQKEELRGKLLNSIIVAQEDERKRISRELHDEYGQTLTGLIMGVESMEDMVPPEQTRLKEKLRTIKETIARAIEDVRRLTFDLRPSALDDLGLVTAIRTYAHTHLEGRGIKLEFESKGINMRLTTAVETSLFRIIQEAINNIIKHSGASLVRIQVTGHDGKITAVVEDNGQGFDVESVVRSRIGTESLGLLGIRERTMLLGGTFTIKSWPGARTYLKVEIPVTGAPEEAAPKSG